MEARGRTKTPPQSKLNKDLQAQSVWKKYQDALRSNKYQGADRDAMKHKLLQWSYDHGLDPSTGKLLTPDQISKRSARPGNYIAPTVTGQDIIDKMKKKLAGDKSVELSQSEVRYLKSIGFDPETGSLGNLYASIQVQVMKSNLKKYNAMPDGDDKKYYHQSILRYAWEYNMTPDGSGNGYLNPDEIKNKGSEPPEIPPDIQAGFDKDKADYENKKQQYDKDFQKYQQKLAKYSAFQDLRVQQMNAQNLVDKLRNTGKDYDDAQSKLDEINTKIADMYDRMSV